MTFTPSPNILSNTLQQAASILRVPEKSPHQVFVETVFTQNGPFPGVLGEIFRVFARAYVTAEDFDVVFHFARGEWHIRLKPKTSLGKFAIQQLKEATIQSELSKEVV